MPTGTELGNYTSRGHSLTACNAAPPTKFKMAARGPQNGRENLESDSSPDFGRSRKVLLNKFFDPSTPSMREVDDREKKEKEKRKGEKEKIMSFIVAINIVASRPPKSRLTGTPTARANTEGQTYNLITVLFIIILTAV